MSATHEQPHAHDASHDAPPGYYERMTLAVFELLVDKGVVTPEQVAREIEAMDGRTPERGARVVARAWKDPAYKARLLADGNAACKELGIDVAALQLLVVENTPAVHNVVVCTLCSCYPRMLMGPPPAWYKSKAYRSRVVREPRAVLSEFGVDLPDDVQIRVHDSTADMRYLVLPLQPAGTQHLSEEELIGTISRDAMIGTAVVRSTAM